MMPVNGWPGMQMPLPLEMSREADESIEPDKNRLRGLVLNTIRRSGGRGMTCDEVEAHLEMRHQTASARVHELMKAGRIVEVGVRKTRSGRNATVWCVA